MTDRELGRFDQYSFLFASFLWQFLFLLFAFPSKKHLVIDSDGCIVIFVVLFATPITPLFAVLQLLKLKMPRLSKVDFKFFLVTSSPNNFEKDCHSLELTSLIQPIETLRGAMDRTRKTVKKIEL